MEVVDGAIGVLLGGLVVGALARFALPGPDPLPVWMTIALGVAGAFLGGMVIGMLRLVPPDATEGQAVGSYAFAAVGGATLLLALYRRFGQHRPLTGPGADRLPLRPRGLGRIATRRPHRYLEETESADGDPIEGLRKLVALRDAGQIDAAEFERRKAAFVERL